MKRNPVLFGLFIVMQLSGLVACKHTDTPKSAVCRLTSTTDQLVETSGKLTDELLRTFAYTNGTLTTITEQSANATSSFTLTNTNGLITQAVSGSMVIAFTYSAGGTMPVSATFSRGGIVQSTYSLTYITPTQLNSVTENRAILYPNSLVTNRFYTFTYDKDGNVITERAQSTLTGNVISAQETEYIFNTRPSPYALVSGRSVLTVIALSQAVETKPGRFWQPDAYTAYKTYILTSTGSRGSVRDESTFAPVYDADNKLMSQEQNALLYQGSNPTPISKRNRQTFGYQCE